ncbi:MAG: Nramp family divalent metal transporter [Saprospiraceae bacterium]|nr:Nramp family divalent metal transporter [Saprospiraceae bacterium]
MQKYQRSGKSLDEVHESIDTTVTLSKGKKILAFLGPAYLVSVGYMDPGNWATDLAGGSKYGYSLIWVLLMSNIMALFLQSLSARLGLVRRLDLAQANREVYPPVINFFLYLLAEIAIAACDLAEVLGMAIGIQLLTGLPLIYGVGITVFDTFLLLMLQRYGMRVMELFIIGLVAVVSVSFFIEMIIAKPNIGEIAKGFVPSLQDSGALYIAIGIIGATVMPHNLYLHSALVQTRKVKREEGSIRQAIRLNNIDSAIALNIAFLVNASILILAAAMFYKNGLTHIAEIQDAHQLLASLTGTSIASTVFAIALIAAGQSSTITGTLAGQIIMEGYLNLRINPMIRRLLTRLLAITPAVFTILFFGEEKIGELLILSQVVLSVQLGFAIIPLIYFVSNKEKMGVFKIGIPAQIFAWIISVVIVSLNIKMVVTEVNSMLQSDMSSFYKVLIILILILLGVLMLFSIGYLYFKRPTNNLQKYQQLHTLQSAIGRLEKPMYKRIAIALDFSDYDIKTIQHAIAQGNKDTTYYLIHIVESAPAQLLGTESDDIESRQDKQQLETYVRLLVEENIQAKAILGYQHRIKELVKIVKDNQIDLLVMGAHGHSGFFDWLYGETINQVRHKISIPVLVIQG